MYRHMMALRLTAKWCIPALWIVGVSSSSCTRPTRTEPVATATIRSPLAPFSPEAPTWAGQIGMNLGSATLDFDATRLYADVILTSREFTRPGGEPAAVDASGWPTEDFKCVVWHGIDRMHGAYALSFKGQAEVSAAWGATSLSRPKYDPGSNTTTLQLHFRDTGKSGLELTFSNTRRSPKAPLHSGISELRMLRPVSPDADQSEPTSTLFHRPAKELLSRFEVLRFMDFLATNSNQQREWVDRPLPSQPSFNRSVERNGYGWQGRGGPWEHVVLLANELGVDVWINIPVRASDDYVRKVAQLFRYGSDGVVPYTAPRENPTYPPLDPKLRLYVEYGNELWNSAGSIFGDAFTWNAEQAAAEVATGKSPLAYDGESNRWYLAWRRIAKRGVEISYAFREVFGDGAMHTRVRPVFMTHQGNAQETLKQGMKFLHGYLNNGEGEFVRDPHPPGHYFYGAGGSAYYSPNNQSEALTLESFWSSEAMDVRNWHDALAKDADLVAAMGLRRIAYEGGPSLDTTGTGDQLKAAAVTDERMRHSVIAHHTAWGTSGGDLLMYYVAVGDYQFGFTPDAYELKTPKLAALEDLNGMARSPLKHGTPIPGASDGNNFRYTSLDWGTAGRGAKVYSHEPGQANWGTYTFRANVRSQRKLVLEITEASSDARASVFWDGVLVSAKELPSGDARIVVGSVDVTPGLHGVIVRAASGTFELREVAIE